MATASLTKRSTYSAVYRWREHMSVGHVWKFAAGKSAISQLCSTRILAGGAGTSLLACVLCIDIVSVIACRMNTSELRSTHRGAIPFTVDRHYTSTTRRLQFIIFLYSFSGLICGLLFVKNWDFFMQQEFIFVRKKKKTLPGANFGLSYLKKLTEVVTCSLSNAFTHLARGNGFEYWPWRLHFDGAEMREHVCTYIAKESQMVQINPEVGFRRSPSIALACWIAWMN